MHVNPIPAGQLRVVVLASLSLIWSAIAAEQPPRNLAIASAGLGDDFVALYWDKPDPNANPTVTGYSVMRNGMEVMATTKLHAFVSGLTPGTTYTFAVRANGSGGQSANSNELSVRTNSAAPVFDVTAYGARGDGVTDDWAAIKAAIAACTPGGKVFFPGRKTYLTGSIRIMKSDIYVKLGDSAVIQANPAKTMPTSGSDTAYFQQRKSGTTDANNWWTLFLIGNMPDRENANFATESQKRVVTDVRIYGNGHIYCSLTRNATELNTLVAASASMRARRVLWQGLKIYGGSGWLNTIDFSDNVTVMDCKVGSPEPETGESWCWADGWNPVFSSCIYFMGCDFATNDDCIAFKTEKCRTGDRVGLCPILDQVGYVHHVRITNCRFFRSERSAAICCGSELSQGVSDIFVQDCEASGVQDGGFLIKGAPDRGGFARNIVIKDSKLDLHGFNYYTSCSGNGPYPNDIRDILLENVQTNSGLCSSPNQTIRNVTFINCTGSVSMNGPTQGWSFYGCPTSMTSSGAAKATTVPTGYQRLTVDFPCDALTQAASPRRSRAESPGLRPAMQGNRGIVVVNAGAAPVLVADMTGRVLARTSAVNGIVALPKAVGAGALLVITSTGPDRRTGRMSVTR